jgi:hypothetical protein
MGLKSDEAANETVESRNRQPRDQAEADQNENLTVTSVGSVESTNLIMQSMRDALITMNEKARRMKANGVNQFEKML